MDFPSVLFFALYDGMVSIVLPRLGLAGTIITSPFPALGCSGDFLRILLSIFLVSASRAAFGPFESDFSH